MSFKDIKVIRKVFANEISKAKTDTIKVKDLGYEDEFLNEILFEENEKGGKTFSKEILPVLTKIDFTSVDFGGFFCRDYDFSKLKGVEINPQRVYNKSLYGAKLRGVKFIGPFDEVDIVTAKFTGSIGAKIDPEKILKKEIHYTDCCDVEFIGSFESLKISFVSFKGSKGAVINPQLLGSKSMYRCDFSDVTFTGSFKNTDIRECSFAGSVGAIINPQEVTDLYNSSFKDVKFIGSFDGVRILNCDFTGSTGAIINPQTIWYKEVTGVCFTDALIDGSFKGIQVKRSQLKGAKFKNYDDIFNKDFKREFKIKIAELTNKNYVK